MLSLKAIALATALLALALIQTVPVAPEAPAARANQQQAPPPKQFANSIGMKFVRIPAGKFVMGSPEDEKEREAGEDQHEVEIARPFYLAVHTVTQAEYAQIMDRNPSHFCATGPGKDKVAGMNTERFPVEMVSWNDAVAFCRALSELPREKAAGRVYRLPTEAEWEYACRAGTTTTFHCGNSLSSRQANFCGRTPYGDAEVGPHLGRPTTVGSYPPNAFGLYDMHGNVWQWCRSTEEIQVFRGGGWSNFGGGCRAAIRRHYPADTKLFILGFRVAVDQARP